MLPGGALISEFFVLAEDALEGDVLIAFREEARRRGGGEEVECGGGNEDGYEAFEEEYVASGVDWAGGDAPLGDLGEAGCEEAPKST